MTDPLDLLRALPREQPSDALRRQVRIAALDRLAQSQPPTLMQRLLDQFAIPAVLAAASVVCLLNAAAQTPLLR